MTEELYLEGESLCFIQGFPALYAGYMLPQANVQHATGLWGTICVQELRSEDYLIRHFFFKIKRKVKIESKERREGLQSIIGLEGQMDYELRGQPKLSLRRGLFYLMNAHDGTATVDGANGINCSVFNTYYRRPLFEYLFPYFPEFKKLNKKAERRALIFNITGKRVRHSVHDAIQDIWLDRYVPLLQEKYIELRLKSSLCSMLADSYTLPIHGQPTPFEQEKAEAIRDFILQNIRKHFTADEIALQFHCSASWLKRTFSKVYRTGLFHYLREHRMEKAKEMLLRGESLKAVAIEVGMKPRNFPKEFKSFFGYTVTELKKGLYR